MQIFASGEGRKLSAPDEFLPQGSVGKVVGLIDLGKNNRSNDFGWSGVKTVIDFEGDAYVLDFPEHTRLVTDDGLELLLRPHEVSSGGIFDAGILKVAHHPLG